MTDTKTLIDIARGLVPAPKKVYGLNSLETEFTRESEDFSGLTWKFYINEQAEIEAAELISADGSVKVPVNVDVIEHQQLEDIRAEIVEILTARREESFYDYGDSRYDAWKDKQLMRAYDAMERE